jgi:hypothetical protein
MTTRILTQSFFYTHNLSVDLIARSKNNFFMNTKMSGKDYDYSNLSYETYLSLNYLTTENDKKTKESIWFSYNQLFGLKKVFKSLAVLLETKLDEIFKVKDDGKITLNADYKILRKVESITLGKDLFITLAVIVDEEGYFSPAITLHVITKTNAAYLSIDQFLGLALIIDNLNLLVSGQNLVNSFLTSKLISSQYKKVSNITIDD